LAASAAVVAASASPIFALVSVISVGRKATVPKRRCAAPIAAIPSADVVSLNSTPPPPFTCQSTKPGASSPATARRAAPAGTSRSATTAAIRPLSMMTACPSSRRVPSKTRAPVSATGITPSP